MLTVTPEFKTAIKKPSVYSDGKIDIGNYEGGYANNLFPNGNTGSHYHSYYDFTDTVNIITTPHFGLETMYGGTFGSSVKFVTTKSNYNIKGHKFYFKMDYKTSSSDNIIGTSFDFGTINVGGINTVQITGYSNTWVVYDRLFQADTGVDNTSTSIALWVYMNIAPLNETTISVFMDNFILIDLTETFGAGNEPAYEDCQTIFNTEVGSFFTTLDLTEFVPIISFTSDAIKRIEIYGSAHNNDKIIGNIAQHVLEIEILGNQTYLIPRNSNTLIQPFLGIMVGSSFEYVKYQDFMIEDVKHSDTTNVTTITATDRLIMLNREFVDNLTYPISLLNYTKAILADCGLELHNTSFINSSFSIIAQPFEDYTTVKEIIQQVAELACSFVIVNKISNKVELISAFETLVSDESIDKSNYYKLKFNAHNFGSNGINTCVMRISQVEGENNTVENSTNVAIDGPIEVVIQDNQFVKTEALRLSVIDAIFDEIEGYKFEPYSLEYRGFPYLEIGDCISVTKMDNTTVLLPIFKTHIKYNGGLSGKLNANTLSKSQTDFKNTGGLDRVKRFAQILVDKANAKIELKVSKDSVVSSINLTPESVKINASKIDISGVLSVLGTAGSTVINGSNITTGTINASVVAVTNINASNITSGTINANRINAGYLTAGSIGGWTINTNTISRNGITLGADYISLGNTGTTGSTINLGTAKIYNIGGGGVGISGYMTVGGDISPQNDNTSALGSLAARFKELWAVDGSINTSDITDKRDIKTIDNGVEFVLNLKPVQFKWKDRVRNHYGFIAQDVKETMTYVGIDDAGVYIDPVAIGSEGFKGLRYHELIAPMVQAIQYLHQRVKELENAS